MHVCNAQSPSDIESLTEFQGQHAGVELTVETR